MAPARSIPPAAPDCGQARPSTPTPLTGRRRTPPAARPPAPTASTGGRWPRVCAGHTGQCIDPGEDTSSLRRPRLPARTLRAVVVDRLRRESLRRDPDSATQRDISNAAHHAHTRGAGGALATPRSGVSGRERVRQVYLSLGGDSCSATTLVEGLVSEPRRLRPTHSESSRRRRRGGPQPRPSGRGGDQAPVLATRASRSLRRLLFWLLASRLRFPRVGSSVYRYDYEISANDKTRIAARRGGSASRLAP